MDENELLVAVITKSLAAIKVKYPEPTLPSLTDTITLFEVLSIVVTEYIAATTPPP
jgi:hypothetical protein